MTRMRHDLAKQRDLVRSRGTDRYLDESRPARPYRYGPPTVEMAEAISYVRGYTGRNRFVKSMQQKRRNSRDKSRWTMTEAQASTVLEIKAEEAARLS